MPNIRFQRVAELINSCCDAIDNYLQEYVVWGVMELQRTQATSITCIVYLVDAMGNKHDIPMSMARTRQQFIRVTGDVYTPNGQWDIIHRRFLKPNRFCLGVDDGKYATEIKSDEDMHELVHPGTKVVLSIVVEDWESWESESAKSECICPLCRKTFRCQRGYHLFAINCATRGCKDYIRFNVIEPSTSEEVDVGEDVHDSIVNTSMIVNIHRRRWHPTDILESS
ncbi:hypothetical protein DXG01_015463 [Tephrocybe rancida]|nr:hypothetical protein DXG01_015463 [Tephrocybe rancida]